MNPVAASTAVAGLAALAGAGVIAGFLRDEAPPIDDIEDPLEDRRLALDRSLADLDEARDSGALEPEEYDRLRRQTEARIARVVRALERREEREPVDEVFTAAEGEGDRRAAAPTRSSDRRVPPWAVAVLIGGTVLAMVVAALVRDTAPVESAGSVPSTSDDPLAFFEERVEANPDDLAARLDLAHRYLDANRVEDALEQYAVALELDPDDAEAHAHVGLILYMSGRGPEALESVDRALETDPGYPEALFIRGVILLRGLDRPDEAIEAFERYLDVAPFGIERGTAETLIEEAEAAIAGP